MKGSSFTSLPFRLRPHLLPIIVWLGALAIVVVLFSNQTRRFEAVGMARGQIREISSTCDGRLKSVNVGLFDRIKEGQTVVVVDTVMENEELLEADLNSQLAAAMAQIEHLTAQLVPAQETLLAEEADREMNRVTEIRRFVVDAEQARLQVLDLKAQIASDQILLADLASELKITKELLESEAVAPYELQKAQVQYDSLAKKIQENQSMLEQAEEHKDLAEKRLQEFKSREVTQPSVDKALDVIRKEIRVQEELVHGLVAQLEALKNHKILEIKSPVDGIVIQIQEPANRSLATRPGENVMKRPGEVVRTGEPIMAVTELKPTEIVVYVSEEQRSLVRESTTVEVASRGNPGQAAQCEVAYIGPTLELIPERLWRNPNIPQWGWPVVIKIPEQMELVSGELVGVRTL
jgi:multidrug resistance efflux pump